MKSKINPTKLKLVFSTTKIFPQSISVFFQAWF